MRGPALTPSRHATLVEALEVAAKSPKGVVFFDTREQPSPLAFSEILERARRVAGALELRGVRSGDSVALVLPTGPDFLDAFFGAVLAGAVPVPLYPPIRLGRLEEYHLATERMLRGSGARLVVSSATLRWVLGPAVAGARPPLGLTTAQELLALGSPFQAAAKPEDLALIQFSSGSTTHPKPVALTHRHLVAQTAALAQLFPAADQVGVSWLPLYHDMGLIGCLLAAVCFPGQLVLIPPEQFLARPALWLRALSRFRGTASAAPSFAFGLCLKRVADDELAGVDLSSWRHAFTGAETVSPPLLQRFAERFSRYGFDPSALSPVYGLAEATLAVTVSPRRTPVLARRVDPDHLARTRQALPGPREVASVGVPVPGCEVEVRDDAGTCVPEGRLGRVFVRSPSVMQGYHGDLAATAQVLAAGWLDTGDLGFIEDGELFLCGRAKDVIILRGANHSPQRFEECLEDLPEVRTGCAIAAGFLPPGDEGEALLILAERARADSTEAQDRATAERIVRAVTERTQIRPHTVRVLAPGTLPRTSSGKLRRAEALRRFLSNELTPPAAVTPLGLAAQLARSAFARLAGAPRREG